MITTHTPFNLNKNIKQGNSLLATNNLYNEEGFNWKKEYPDIIKKYHGFTIILSNPPYLRQENIPKKEKQQLTHEYQLTTGVSDLYMYFYEKELKLLAPDGHLAIITPQSYITRKYAEKLRKHLASDTTITHLKKISQNIFNAEVITIITILTNHTPTKTNKITVNDKFQLPQKYLTEKQWKLYPVKVYQVLDKINSNSHKLTDGNVTVSKGFYTGAHETFILTQEQKDEFIRCDPKNEELIYPVYRGREIMPYHIEPVNSYILMVTNENNLDDYPVVREYLLEYKERLLKRERINPDEWYLTNFKQVKNIRTSPSQIIYSPMGYRVSFTCNQPSHFNSSTIGMIDGAGENNKWWTCVLNSNVTRLYIQVQVAKLSKGGVNLTTYLLRELRIPHASEEQMERLNVLHDRIVKCYDEDKVDEALTLSDEVDKLVYDLFGLTEEDVRVLEEVLDFKYED